MSVAQRKDDHIAQCLKDPAVDRSASGFDSITLAHRALPEIDFDKIDKARGMDISLITTAKTDEESKELLSLLGAPFKTA